MDLHRFRSGFLRAILAIKGRTMRPTDIAAIHSDEFKRDAVRFAQSSKDQKTIRGIVFPEDGLTRRQVASDLGIRCPAGHCAAMAREGGIRRSASGFGYFPKTPKCLRRMPRRLARERTVAQREPHTSRGEGSIKKSCDVLRGSKAVKFQYIAEYRGGLTRSHLCHLMGVTERGFRAWKHRPPSHRQRRDMVLLAHIRDPLAGRACLHAREAAPPEPWQLRQASHDRGVERAGPAGWPAVARQRFACKP